MQILNFRLIHMFCHWLCSFVSYNPSQRSNKVQSVFMLSQFMNQTADFNDNLNCEHKSLGTQSSTLNEHLRPMLDDMLSHTWVRYPGFSGHGVKCPILTTVVPGFSGDLIGCTIRSKWGSFGDLYHARKKLLCVWNKLFLAEIKFFQRRTRPVKSLWWQIVHIQESTNEWKNLTIF